MKVRFQNSLLAATILVIAAATTNAASINGIFWSVPASTADNVPTLGNTPGPGATEWGTFNASAIEFSGDTNYSVGGFLNSFGAASNITYMNGASASSSLTDVLFEFTGTALFTNGQNFTVVHDDGVNMYVNGSLVLGDPTPTAPVSTPYTYSGPAGDYGFDFIYANGPPVQADFQTTLVSPTTITGSPEPATFVLVPTGCIALLWLVYRKGLLRTVTASSKRELSL